MALNIGRAAVTGPRLGPVAAVEAMETSAAKEAAAAAVVAVAPAALRR